MSTSQPPAFARVLPFALYLAFLVADQPLSVACAGLGLDPRWLYAVRIGAVVLALVWCWRGYDELRDGVDVPPTGWLVAVATGVMVLLFWILPFPAWATLGEAGNGFNPLATDGRVDIGLAAVRIAGAALVVPLMEELFWRSYLMRWIRQSDFMAVDPAGVGVRALVVSSALFAVEHTLWLAGLVAGLAYAWLYRRYRNLWVPVLSHAVTNGLLGFWVINQAAWQYW